MREPLPAVVPEPLPAAAPAVVGRGARAEVTPTPNKRGGLALEPPPC